MRRTILLGMLLWSLASCAADKIQSLNVKPGLWEVTTTAKTSGVPPLPPETLAKLSPEQRATLEQKLQSSMSQEARTRTRQRCLTQEKMNQQPFVDEPVSCKREVMTSSSSKLEVHVQCTNGSMMRNGTYRIEAVNSENIKGSMLMDVTGGNKTMNMNSTFTAKWLGSACGSTR